MKEKIAALISATPLSSDSDGLGLLRPMGNISAARRMFATLEQCSIDLIVMITGDREDELKKDLSHVKVVFLHNPQYRNGDMLSSIKVGCAWLENQVSHLLVIPGCAPLFNHETVEALIAARDRADIIVPEYEGRSGHPVLLSADLIPSVLAYEGEDGLNAALRESGAEVFRLPVTDRGVLVPDEEGGVRRGSEVDEVLLAAHNKQMYRLRQRYILAGEENFFGPGPALLLELIRMGNSVSSACQKMNLSYSKGWYMIHRLERELGAKVLSSRQGGAGGGMSQLTALGEELLERYRRFSSEAGKASEKIYKRVFAGFFDSKRDEGDSDEGIGENSDGDRGNAGEDG